jgi:4-aminobutyrate--pyruvate transaminase
MPQPTNRAARDIEALIHPYTNLAAFRETGPLVIERGQGVCVFDSAGKEYIDGMAGLWCTALGWGNEELIEAAAAQMRKLAFGHLFGGKSHDGPVELAERLKEIAPVPTSKVFFCNSGSEANDTQIKLIWYMNNALGRPQKKKIISRMKDRFRPSDRQHPPHRLPAPLPLRARRRERAGLLGAARGRAG